MIYHFDMTNGELKKSMTRQEKINYLRIALGLQKIVINDQTSDIIIETYEKILKLEGEFSIKDAIEIEMVFDKKYAKVKTNNKL